MGNRLEQSRAISQCQGLLRVHPGTTPSRLAWAQTGKFTERYLGDSLSPAQGPGDPVSNFSSAINMHNASDEGGSASPPHRNGDGPLQNSHLPSPSALPLKEQLQWWSASWGSLCLMG